MVNPKDKSSSKRKAIVVAGLLVAAIVALVLLFQSKNPKNPLTAAVVPEPEPTRHAPPSPWVPPSARPPAAAPIIDEILLEKKEVCEGEENLVTVRAHLEDSRDNVHLHGTINGVSGLSVPVLGKKNLDHKMMVVVFGRDNVPTIAEVPPFVVKDCVVDRAMMLQHNLRPNTSAEFEFTARVVNVTATEPFEAASYFWEFGDGTSLTTKEPYAVHDYSQRPQLSVTSAMLLRVEAESTTHELVVGRRAVLLHNDEYSNLENAGVVTLVVELNPRFPEIKDGMVIQNVRLWHHRPEPVRITKAQARRNSTLPDTPPELRDISVTGLLGTSTIPPSGIRFTMKLDIKAEPNTFSIDYLLEGVSAEGYPVQSSFSVMKPNLPTAENHIPVTDPMLTKRILMARDILGKEFVTEGDLMELERKGAFDSLDGGGASPDEPDPAPPYDNPDPH